METQIYFKELVGDCAYRSSHYSCYNVLHSFVLLLLLLYNIAAFYVVVVRTSLYFVIWDTRVYNFLRTIQIVYRFF